MPIMQRSPMFTPCRTRRIAAHESTRTDLHPAVEDGGRSDMAVIANHGVVLHQRLAIDDAIAAYRLRRR